jgi:sulfide dehydrogenase [flavocytochrome c] flavoprotein subunit
MLESGNELVDSLSSEPRGDQRSGDHFQIRIPGARTVRLASGSQLTYDRLILSPGIDFVPDSVPGWSLGAHGKMPHAYRGGTQLALLRHQVLAMRPGGVFALIAPPNPYRCPPGPYERVSMLAHTLRETNPRAKLLIIDPKTRFA